MTLLGASDLFINVGMISLAITGFIAVIMLIVLAIAACCAACASGDNNNNDFVGSGRHSSGDGFWNGFFLGWWLSSSNHNRYYDHTYSSSPVMVSSQSDTGGNYVLPIIGAISLGTLGGLAFGGGFSSLVVAGTLSQAAIPVIGWISFGTLAASLLFIGIGMGLRALDSYLKSRPQATDKFSTRTDPANSSDSHDNNNIHAKVPAHLDGFRPGYVARVFTDPNQDVPPPTYDQAIGQSDMHSQQRPVPSNNN